MKNLILPALLFFTFFLSGQEARLVLPLGHVGRINSAVFSPCGKFILTASEDKTARIWDVLSGKELMVLEGDEGGFETAWFSEDGKKVFTTSMFDRTATAYELSTNKKINKINGDGYNAQLSPDKKYVLIRTSKKVCVYSTLNGNLMCNLSSTSNNIRKGVFSVDNKIVATKYKDSSAYVYDMFSGKELSVLRGHSKSVNTVIFSPDGKWILTSSDDKTARIFDVSNGKELKVFKGHKGKLFSAVFSNDAKLVITSSMDETARIYEVSSGKELQVLKGHKSWVSSAVFSDDGKLALTASWDRTARIFEVSTGNEIKVFTGQSVESDGLKLLPDKKSVMASNRYFNFLSGSELTIPINPEYSELKDISTDGQLFLFYNKLDYKIDVFDLANLEIIKSFTGHKSVINYAEFSPTGIDDPRGGKYVITGSDDGTARVYEFSSGKEIFTLSGHKHRVNCAKFSTDLKYAVTASDDETARIYDLTTGGEVFKITNHSDNVSTVEFSSDGKFILTSSNDKTARLFELMTGKEFKKFEGHSSWVNTAVFSPDQKCILTSSDEEAKIFDMSTGKEIMTMKGHSGTVYSAIFSFDGKYIITSGEDNKIIIWETATVKALYTRLQLQNGD